MIAEEISLLKLDGGQDVRGRRQCEKQVTGRHCRCGPESDEPSDIQRMPDQSVWTRCRETQWRVVVAAEVEPNLPQPKEIEVIDQESRDEHREPS